jgi:hypothetical protein
MDWIGRDWVDLLWGYAGHTGNETGLGYYSFCMVTGFGLGFSAEIDREIGAAAFLVTFVSLEKFHILIQTAQITLSLPFCATSLLHHSRMSPLHKAKTLA